MSMHALHALHALHASHAAAAAAAGAGPAGAAAHAAAAPTEAMDMDMGMGSHMDMGMSMNMDSAFRWRTNMGEILFPGWNVHTHTQYAAFCVFVALLCIAREFLYVYRLRIIRRENRSKLPRRLRHAAVASASSSSSNTSLDDDDDNSIARPTELQQRSARQASHPMEVRDDAPLLRPHLNHSSSSSTSSRRRGGSFFSLSEEAVSSLLYGLTMILGYILMLVVMSYNVGVFIVVVLVSTVTHYVLHARLAASEAAALSLSSSSSSSSGAGGAGSSTAASASPSTYRSTAAAASASSSASSTRDHAAPHSPSGEIHVVSDAEEDEEALYKDCCER